MKLWKTTSKVFEILFFYAIFCPFAGKLNKLHKIQTYAHQAKAAQLHI